MGIFSSKPQQPRPSAACIKDLHDIDQELTETIQANPELEQKRVEAESLILEDSQCFSAWLASISVEKLASVCATAEYIHGAVEAYAVRLSQIGVRDPDKQFSLVFRVVLAASEIYLNKRFVSFVDSRMPAMYDADSPSIARGLAVFAARPKLANQILQDRIRAEKLAFFE
jgi:hypothetical protein